MQPATRSSLATIAGQLAALVGVGHMAMGVFYLVDGGTVTGDPRVVLWTAAGAALVGGVAVAATGRGPRWLYAAGVAVVALLVGAQLAWPLVAGGRFYLGAVPATGDLSAVGHVTAQVSGARPAAQVALLVEVALLVVLVPLAADDGRP